MLSYRGKNGKFYKPLSKKVLEVSYKGWWMTRVSNCSDLTWKIYQCLDWRFLMEGGCFTRGGHTQRFNCITFINTTINTAESSSILFDILRAFGQRKDAKLKSASYSDTLTWPRCWTFPLYFLLITFSPWRIMFKISLRCSKF